MTLYINQGTIENFRVDSETGVMTCTAIARGPGILTYRRADGTEWKEFVSPELQRAFDSETGRPSVAGLAGIPVTNEHSTSLLRGDADAIARHKVGETKNKVHVYSDGKVEVTFDVFDAKTQDDIKSGRKKGVSVGYECGSKVDSGEYNGDRYDALQTLPIKFDHLAVCAKPRNQEALITKFDSADDVAVQIVEPVATKEGKQDAEQLYQIEVNGRPFMVPLDLYLAIKAESDVESDEENEDYEDSEMKYSDIFDSEDEELLKEILMDAKAKKAMPKSEEEDMEDEEMDEEEMEDEMPAFLKGKKDSDTIWMSDRIDSLESELSALQAKCDAQDKLLAKFDAIDLEEMIAERVDAILETYNELRPYLPEDFKLDGNASVVGMKLDAIKELDSESDVSDETPEPVLDSVLSVLTRYHRKDSTEMQRQFLNTPASGDSRQDAYQAVNDAYANAWKGGSH